MQLTTTIPKNANVLMISHTRMDNNVSHVRSPIIGTMFLKFAQNAKMEKFIIKIWIHVKNVLCLPQYRLMEFALNAPKIPITMLRQKSVFNVEETLNTMRPWMLVFYHIQKPNQYAPMDWSIMNSPNNVNAQQVHLTCLKLDASHVLLPNIGTRHPSLVWFVPKTQDMILELEHVKNAHNTNLF